MIKAQFIIIFVILNFCFAHESTAQAQNTQPFTFVQMCDTQLGFGGYDDDVKRFKQAVKQINSLQPDFVLICGDLVNKKDDQSFADFNAIKNTFTIPCYPASGNHDVGNQPTHETLANYRKKVGKDYYAVEHKGYTFIFTNTQLWKAPVEGESQKHHDWVVQTLKSAKAKASPVFMVGHYPLYVKDPQEEEAYYSLPIETRNELFELYKANGVIAVLAGHTHKKVINEYAGIALVNGETTSKNFDKRPFGFRLWKVGAQAALEHAFVELTN